MEGVGKVYASEYEHWRKCEGWGRGGGGEGLKGCFLLLLLLLLLFLRLDCISVCLLVFRFVCFLRSKITESAQT